MLTVLPSADAVILYKGDALDVQFSVVWETGLPVDLTTFNARFRVLNTGLSKDSVNPGDITLVTPLDLGKLIVHIFSPDTAALNSNYEYTYKAELYDIQGNVYTFKEAAFNVL